MIIKTNFNVGEVVYYSYDGRVIENTILRIYCEAHEIKPGEVVVENYYVFFFEGDDFVLPESKICKTYTEAKLFL